MILFKKAFFKVWKVEDKGKYKALQCSTSDKQQDGTYKNSSWNVRLVGKANVDVKKGDRIEVTNGKVENVYDKEKNRSWLNVIAFELAGAGEQVQEQESNDDDLPF